MVCLTDEPDSELSSKILKFESYVDDVLRTELEEYLKMFHLKEADLDEWLQLKRMISTMKEQNLPGFKGKINLGSNVYVPVEVPDTSRLIMNLGIGVFVEMTLDDSLAHTNLQINKLETEISFLSDCINSLKARIQVLLQGITEYHNLS